MRRRTSRQIQRREQAIHEEGFGIASVAREGAAEIRELAEHMRKLWALHSTLVPPNPPRARNIPRSEGNRHARRALVAQRRGAR